MPKKNKNHISVSLTENVLKIVAVQGGRNPRITQAFYQSVAGMSVTELSKAVHSGMKGFKVKGSRIVCVVPSSMATTKNIEIPSTDKEEIWSIVNLQAGRHTPFSREEIQVGYVNLGVFNSSYTRVLLVIANRNKIKQQIDVLIKAGIQVAQVLFAPEGIASFYSQALEVGGETQPFAVIDVDADQTDIVIISAGLPIASRSIPIGKRQLIADMDSGVTGLVDELKQTIESYQADDIGAVPSSFLLTGQDAVESQIQNALQNNLSWAVQVADLGGLIKATKSADKRLSSYATDRSFADVITASATASALQVNLLPEEIKIQKNVEDQGRQLFRAAVLGIIILFFVGAGLGAQVFLKNIFLERLVNNYQSVHDEAAVFMAHQERVQIIKNYMNDRMASLDMLHELYQYIPKSIYLTSISLEDNGAVSIQGVSESGSEVYNFGSTLEGVELFRKAQVMSTSSKKDRGRDATAFEIAITLTSAEETEDITN